MRDDDKRCENLNEWEIENYKMDKNSGMPLYMQVKRLILGLINTGKLKPGDIIPTEIQLCNIYNISRFPVRQALLELAGEGYIERTRGRGSFVSKRLPKTGQSELMSRQNESTCENPVLGLILGGFTSEFSNTIFLGFQKQAWKRGYFTIACSSECLPNEEILYINKLIENQVKGIVIYPCDNSVAPTKIELLKKKDIYIGFIDRNLGINSIDYTGSDNQGGAYSAIRHMAMQGFRNIVFISDKSNVSSINERLEGYLKAVEDFGMNALTRINIKEDLSRYPFYMHRFFIERLKEELGNLEKYLPLGIFAVNDSIALQCIKILKDRGLIIGKDIGIVGFDNNPETQYMNIPLTTVAQNGYLIGKNAADIAVDKIESKTNQVYRTVVPTQLIVRNSCGEKD